MGPASWWKRLRCVAPAEIDRYLVWRFRCKSIDDPCLLVGGVAKAGWVEGFLRTSGFGIQWNDQGLSSLNVGAFAYASPG